jgi:integrative and conjugative element protein (TIGR02256 family)
MTFRYPIGKSGQYLVLNKVVLNHFHKWRQLHPGMAEAGGQLFGVTKGTTITISLATGPRRSDRRGRFFFLADRFSERLEISALHKTGLHYFGDWHTHPQNSPTPSSTDLATMADLFARSKHELHAFVMVIVGTADFSIGLHVSLHEANAWSKLEAEDMNLE